MYLSYNQYTTQCGDFMLLTHINARLYWEKNLNFNKN